MNTTDELLTEVWREITAHNRYNKPIDTSWLRFDWRRVTLGKGVARMEFVYCGRRWEIEGTPEEVVDGVVEFLVGYPLYNAELEMKELA